MNGDGGGDESPFPNEYDGPTVDIPSVDIPGPDGDELTDSNIIHLFFLHVVLWNTVLLCLSVGLMMIYFRNEWTTGIRLLLVGFVLFIYGVYRWPDTESNSN